MRALVLDGNSAAALETLQALGRAGVRVHVSSEDPDCLAFRSRYACLRMAQPSAANPEEFIAWLGAQDDVHRYVFIVPSTEISLLALRELPETDPLRVKAVLPSNEALEATLDKRKTFELAARLGIPVPDWVCVTSLERLPAVAEYPVVLKPLRSTVRTAETVRIFSAAVACDESARLDVLERTVPHVPVAQQRYVPGHGVGIEFLFNGGHEVRSFGHERVHELPLTGGGSSYRRSVQPRPEWLEAARRLLGFLRWHGVAMVELRVQPDGTFYLMEINPRLWGSLALAIDAGVNFPLGLFKIAIGDPLSPQPSYREHYYTRNLLRDIEWLKANLRADHRDPLLLTRPRGVSLLEYFRPLLGRESWDHFDIRDHSVTRTILARIFSDTSRQVKTFLRRRFLVRKLVKRHRRRFGTRQRTDYPITRLLFLCYGNICRSPFAEQIARPGLDGCVVESAGFYHAVGRRSPDNVIRAARSRGIDLTGTRSSRVTSRQVAQADLILVMDLDTYELLAAEFPEAVKRTTLLGLFSPEPGVSIPDPYRLTAREAERVLERIEAAVNGLCAWLGGNRQAGARLSSESPARTGVISGARSEYRLVGRDGDGPGARSARPDRRSNVRVWWP